MSGFNGIIVFGPGFDDIVIILYGKYKWEILYLYYCGLNTYYKDIYYFFLFC